ncbi:MAG: hypothetical protein ABIS69_02480 [Sediminibacterium sp.]
MKKKSILILLLVNFLFACETQQKEKTAEEKKDSLVTAADPIRSAMSFLNDYNALEQLFSNDNWMIPAKKDTNYFYFSRLGNFQVKTYEYILSKGDSSKVKQGLIQTEGDKITWTFNNQQLVLVNATKAIATWSVVGADSLTYTFQRLDNNSASIVYPDKKKLVLKKLLPISLFLVRTRYDFANGTHYAFDTTQFNRKGR